MKEITAYACEFCPKHYRAKTTANRHERRCFRNPARRACIACKNLCIEKADTETGDPGGRACLVDIDLTHSLKADCPSWEASQ